jgi:rare lipoprotein A
MVAPLLAAILRKWPGSFNGQGVSGFWQLVRVSLLIAGLGSILLVAGCGGTAQAEGAAGGQSGRRVYHGIASFYGPGFEGQETASGRIFDSDEMVAAHRTLPFGTMVRVTNLENNRRVVLRIVDRGPYVGRNTIIDVSKGAARRLGFVRDGRVKVRVEVLRLGRD